MTPPDVNSVRVSRALFAGAGGAMLLWGGWLMWEFLSASTLRAVQGTAWFVAGPLVHDALVAPVVGLLALLVGRRLPVPWRGPVAVGGVLSGVLVLLAIPLLWQPFGVPANPGLHDRDYGVGLAIGLGVVWLGVLAAGLPRSRRGRHRRSVSAR